MFGTIRKHQNWLWFVIIAVVSLSMVVYFQPGKQGNGEAGSGNFGSIDNKTISAAEKQNAMNEAALACYLRWNEWPDSSRVRAQFDWERESYQRLFLLRRLQEYNIHTDPEAAAQVAGMILRRSGNGQQQVPMEAFVEQLLKPHNLTAEDFQHFIEHDLAIQQLVSVIGASGSVVTPAEIQTLYVQENQELAVEAVFFSASNSLAKIQTPTPEALGQFYTNQMANYREPDQMEVSYVFFNVTNFMPQAEQLLGTNLNQDVNNALSQLSTNAIQLGKTVEEQRAKIREILIQNVAITNAYAKAIAFQNAAVKEPMHVENMITAAKEMGLEVKVTKPFQKEFGPSEMNLIAGQQRYPVESLFNLTAEEPFVNRPIRGGDGVYVLAFNKLIPSRILPLSDIHARVEADFKFAQALRMAQINGQVFSQTATNELAHGKTFAATCAAATNEKLVEVAPFSLTSQRMPDVEEHADVNAFKEKAYETPIGSASGFTQTREGGFVLYVKQRLPINEVKMKTDLPDFSKAVRQRRETESFDIWFRQEASRALRDIPLFQRQAELR